MTALKRWLKRIATGIVGLLILLAAAGYFFEWRADASARRQPMPGRLVDVGGYRLHLLCHGSGGPTVVLSAGFLDSLAQWERVQPQVATFTQVCAYDRAGVGWSDRGPAPRTAAHEAEELHTLLRRAGIPGPYVLAGHSYSGLIVRLFALRYPQEVAGMVLDDAVDPEEMAKFPNRFSIPKPLSIVMRATAPLGVPRWLGVCHQTGAVPDCPRFVQATFDDLAHYGESHAEVPEEQSLGNMPLAVLAHDPKVGLDKHPSAAFEAAWTQWQRRQASLSSNSRFVQAVGVDHEIQTRQPGVVIEAIRWVVESVRNPRAAAMIPQVGASR